MGGSSSTERVETVVKEEKKLELLEEPWRKIKWTHSTQTHLMQSLKEYKPCIDSVPQARILLIGPVGAGKSSFFNSINSIFRGSITSQAIAGDSAVCMTLKYRTYQVKAGRGGQPLGFLLCDTMGLEATKDGGVNIEDIVSILKGYILDKYQIEEVSRCLGIQVSQVLPVKNYTYEIELNDTCDILLLTAMKQMLNFADNYFDNWEEDRE